MINLRLIDYPRNQDLQSTDIKLYRQRVIVAGSRGYTNKLEFHKEIVAYINNSQENIIYISGAASSGADRMIINWCARYKYPCIQVPADWDNEGKSAGFKRNIKMLELATHLVCFYNGYSPGTSHMISIASDANIPIRLINI